MNLDLDTVCDFINGGAWSDDEYSESGIRVIKVTNLENGGVADGSFDFLPLAKYEKYKRHELRGDDLVVATVGSHPTQPGSVVGRTARISSRYAGSFLNQNAVCLRVKRHDLVDQRFLYYLSRTILFRHHIESRARGSANQVRMAIGDLRRFSARYPSVTDQKRIAAVLGAYDDLIEANRRRIALLEKMAEELYREWFVRLRFPGHAQTKITKGLPAGWSFAKLPELAEITYGFPFDGARFNTDGRGKPIIRIRNIPDSATSDFTDEEAADKYIVRRGDLLIGMDGEFHINRWHGDAAYLVQRVCRLKAKQSAMEGYLARAVRAPIKHYESILMGATVGHLGAMHLKAIDILVPSAEVVERLAVFNDFDAQIGTLEQANRLLTRTRDLLLPRLISGTLVVDALDIAFPPSLTAGR